MAPCLSNVKHSVWGEDAPTGKAGEAFAFACLLSTGRAGEVSHYHEASRDSCQSSRSRMPSSITAGSVAVRHRASLGRLLPAYLLTRAPTHTDILPKIEPTALPKRLQLLSAFDSGQSNGAGLLRPKTWGGQSGQVRVGAGRGACSPDLSTLPVGSEEQCLKPELRHTRPLINTVLMCSHLLMGSPPDLAGTAGTGSLPMPRPHRLAQGHRRATDTPGAC